MQEHPEASKRSNEFQRLVDDRSRSGDSRLARHWERVDEKICEEMTHIRRSLVE